MVGAVSDLAAATRPTSTSGIAFHEYPDVPAVPRLARVRARPGARRRKSVYEFATHRHDGGRLLVSRAVG